MTNLDHTVFYWLNWVIGESRVLAEVAYFVEGWAPWLIAGLLLSLVIRPRAIRAAAGTTVLLAGLAALLSILIAGFVSEEFYRARPFVVLDQANLLIPQSRDSSFPCAPAVWSAAITMVLTSASENSAWRWSLVLAILIGVTRPILGDHWPSDMLGSHLLGAMLGYLVLSLRSPLEAVGSTVLGAIGRIKRS